MGRRLRGLRVGCHLVCHHAAEIDQHIEGELLLLLVGRVVRGDVLEPGEQHPDRGHVAAAYEAGRVLNRVEPVGRLVVHVGQLLEAACPGSLNLGFLRKVVGETHGIFSVTGERQVSVPMRQCQGREPQAAA